MSVLQFYSGSMDFGKSTLALQMDHNHKTRGRVGRVLHLMTAPARAGRSNSCPKSSTNCRSTSSPSAIGRMVDVVADLERVVVRLEGRVIAEHQRSWGKALTITDPGHVVVAVRLREAFQQPRAVPAEAGVVLRNLADYDRAFGVNIEVASWAPPTRTPRSAGRSITWLGR